MYFLWKQILQTYNKMWHQTNLNTKHPNGLVEYDTHNIYGIMMFDNHPQRSACSLSWKLKFFYH